MGSLLAESNVGVRVLFLHDRDYFFSEAQNIFLCEWFNEALVVRKHPIHKMFKDANTEFVFEDLCGIDFAKLDSHDLPSVETLACLAVAVYMCTGAMV